MNWIHFCLITIVLYGVHDIMLKHLADSVNSTLASLIINGSAALVLSIYLMLQPGNKWRAFSEIAPAKMLFLIGAGIALGVATITFMNAFSRGGNLSIAVPVVYSGVIAICMLFGLLFFRETLDWRQIIGAGLAIAGIYLMSAPK